MIIDATQIEFKNFLKVIGFTNRSSTKESNHFYLSSGYLWRRDSHRLCALKLPDMPADSAYEYPITELESQFSNAVSISMSESGMLHIHDVAQGQAWIAAAPLSTSTKPLQVLVENENNIIEFMLPSNFLSKQLSIFQTKIRKAEFEVDKVDLIVDINEKTMHISSHVNEKVIIPVELVRGMTTKTIRYSFSHFKDFLANSNKFNEGILFQCSMPYYSVIVLSQDIYVSLMHKKE